MASTTPVGTTGAAGATGGAGHAAGGASTTTGSAGFASGAASTSTPPAFASTPPTTALGIVPPPTDMIGVLQSLAILIRAQPSGEMRSTKGLESCVRKMGRFAGREVSQYLREYRCAMDMYIVSDTETIANFELISEPELRDRIREIARRYLTIPGGWESFERAMREEYLDKDSDRITRRTFLDWIETQPGHTLGLSELKREFERRYSQLPLRERLTLDTRRTELFLRAADDVSADRLCFMLADRTAEGGITSDWLRVDDAVSVLTKQRRVVGVHYIAAGVQPRVEEPRVDLPPRVLPQVPLMAPPLAPLQPVAAPVPTAVPVAAPRDARQQPAGNRDPMDAIDALTRQMRELRVEIVGLRRDVLVPAVTAPARPRDGPRCCIWCDSLDHMRAECTELAAAVRDRVVHYQDGRLHLSATGEPLMTRWGRGGMRSFLPRPAGAGVVVAVPPAPVAAPVLARVVVPLPEANVFAGQAISASSGCSSGTSVASSQLSIEELRRGAESIRRATGWNDFVEVSTIHAFLDKKKHVTWEDAIVEEKRRRDEAELDASPPDVVGPRVTRRKGGDIAADVPSSSRAPPPPHGPMEDVRRDAPAKGRGQKATTQEKNKAHAYKLAADIETTTDLKAILEKGILDARVEFSLRDILGIAKREFHELIIDVIKRKRQTISEEVATQIAYASDDDVGAAYDADVCVGESEIGEKHVALVAGPATLEADEDDEEKGAPPTSDYRNEDQWPIDMQHGWALRSANGVKKMMYGACPNIPVKIVNTPVERDNRSGSLAANIPFKQKTDCRADLEGWKNGIVDCSADSYSCFQRFEDLNLKKKNWLEKQTEKLRCTGVLSSEESISGVFEENVCLFSVAGWCDTVTFEDQIG
ncbi:hypothetical protein R1sor_012327 [Riccia sorocarpa]|uniref:Retrotransposon gag domain-containing protein n=1 Tax=Riccia sorocarpa TaxID=122646 RepID=A0ABD3I4P3_9MARC